MSDTPADFQTLFNGVVDAHGGASRLSALDIEVVSIVAKLLVSIRTAEAAEVSRIAETIASLQSSLPAPVSGEAKPLDLTRLSDEQLAQLETIYATADGLLPPAPEPAEAERVRGRAEVCGATLGAYIDQHAERWRFVGPSEIEKIELRNLFSGMARGFITRNLWASIYRSDMQDTIERAVKSALAFAGKGDTKLVANEPTDATPKPPTNIHAHPAAPVAVSNYDFLNGGGRGGSYGDNNQ